MNLVATFLLVFAAWFSGEEHDVAMAVFTVSESSEGLWIDIEYDRNDYARVNPSQSDQPDGEQFQSYLNETTSWLINGEKKAVNVAEIIADDHHFKARCYVKLASKRITDVKVYNRFLLDIQDQTNVVVLKLYGNSRGFRMHEGRQQITATY
ncbi:MAG: DUF6702 family protein [Bacteroidota bacterium]